MCVRNVGVLNTVGSRDTHKTGNDKKTAGKKATRGEQGHTQKLPVISKPHKLSRDPAHSISHISNHFSRN